MLSPALIYFRIPLADVCKKLEKQWNAYNERLNHKINWTCRNGEADLFGQRKNNSDFF